MCAGGRIGPNQRTNKTENGGVLWELAGMGTGGQGGLCFDGCYAVWRVGRGGREGLLEILRNYFLELEFVQQEGVDFD